MHIKKLTVLFTILLAIFFGFLGYKDLFFDSTLAARDKIYAQQQELPPNAPSSKQLGLKRAQIALDEYGKNVVETSRGCNCGPEIDKYTENNHAQWCTMFASWVAQAAGSPVWSEKTNSWRIANSRDFALYLQEKGSWHSREEVIAKKLTPQLGDYIVFWRGKFEDNLGHVDVVVAAPNAAAGTASLVGGNLKDRVQFRENFPYLQHYGFMGFGRPEKN